MWLLVGLGNPGDKYAGNRHNVGFMAIDSIADEYGIGPFKAKYQGQLAEGRIGDHKVALLKPETFMNESGRSVGAAAKFYKIPPERIVAFHDELDLAPAKIRVKTGGGNAGHNGLRSLDAHLGTPDYVRVRLGIGHPGDKDRVHGYVLSDFAKVEREWLGPYLEAIADHLPLLLDGKENDFMSKVAQAVPVKE
ncbi:MAG: aminoacyl-tRNA hydrolase [Micavibrio aeruginosavorus]|nr:aminoacyl-tRNA hydrolase [Micavibrio aeruginosavorus]